VATILVFGSFAESLVNFRGPLLQEMVKRGHCVIACAPRASVEVQNFLKEIKVVYQDIPIDRAGRNLIKDLQTVYRLFLLFRTIKPDLFLGYTIKPVIYGSIGAKLAKVPEIYTMITGLGYAFSGESVKSRCIQDSTLKRLI
jgi:hypothetical protein